MQFICREDKIVAKTVYVDGLMVGCTCPTCGVLIKGDAFAEMLEVERRYLAGKNVYDTTRRFLRLGERNLMTQFLTEPKDPGSPFILIR